MNLFFDTSALVKYFHNERGTERVTALIDDPAHTIWLSDLARVEFFSAMHRKFREEVLNAEQLEQAIEGFAAAVEAFQVEPLGRMVSEKAERLLRKHGRIHALRTLDALHLATYVLISESNWKFVVADRRLYDVGRQEGCALIHPVHETEA